MSFRDSILEHSRAPLWMAEFGVGIPGMANPYFTAMSPLVSALLLVPESIPPFTMLLLLHVLVAACGAYLLVRSLGISVAGAVVSATVAVFNAWVFQRLQAEIYAAYALAYAWFPLAWALLVTWLRTNRLSHAAYAAVPLTFVGLIMPTMAVFLSLGMSIMLAARLVGLLWERQWKQLRLCVAGAVVLGATALWLGVPELIGTREQAALAAGSNRIAAPISAGPGMPNQGWRTWVFSAVDFGHTLLGDVGSRFLPPSTNKLNGFGVPYAPAGEMVLLALIGLFAALAVRRWRQATLAVSHLVLGVALANIFVSGLVYVAAWHWYPLFSRTGIFPGVGAMLLVLIMIFAGVGVDAVLHIPTLIFRGLARGRTRFARLLSHHVTAGAAQAAILAAVGLWAASFVASPAAVWDRMQGKVDEKEPLFPHYHIATAPLQHRERFPHLALLRDTLPEQADPSRLFCMIDTAMWPSPCLEDSALHYGFALVGIGEQSWTPPAYLADTLAAAMVPWNEAGEYSPLLHNFLRLAGVEGVVATREMPLPRLAELPWQERPATEGYGYVSGFLQKERGVEWSPGYLIELFVHTLPDPLDRVTFVRPVYVRDEPEAEAAARDVLGESAFDVGRVAIVHTTREEAVTPQELRDRARSAAGPSAEAELAFASPGPGEWNVRGKLAEPGTLLFSQLYYPGFRAWVNGRAVPVERANLFLTAVAVPAGEITVRLAYAPLPMMLSSLLAVGAAGGLLVATIRPRRAHTEHTQS